MKISPLSQTIVLFVLILSFLVSCSKSVSNPTPTPAPVTPPITPIQSSTPTITSLSVTTGPYNTSVIITGTGFSTTVANDQVLFNGKAAVISAATATQLTVTVPLNAGTGNVRVIVNSITSTGPVFTYIDNVKLTITSTDVNQGTYNSIVNLTGTGFSTVIGENSVFFNGKVATVTAASNILLTVKVPQSAGSGNITVAVNSITATGPVFYYYLSSTVTTIAGSGTAGAVNESGSAASFNNPMGIAVDASGNLYVADSGNNLIRKVSPTGEVTTFAGSGDITPVDGIGTSAAFWDPEGIAVDQSGNLFVTELYSNLVRKITPSAQVSTLAGSYSPQTQGNYVFLPPFSQPYGPATDLNGDVYIADRSNGLIRKITSQGVVTTIAGTGTKGPPVNGTGTAAVFGFVSGVALDLSGDIYVADQGNGQIRKINTLNQVTTFASGPIANIGHLYGIAVDLNGNVYAVDVHTNQVTMITPSGIISVVAGSGISGKNDGDGVTASFNLPQAIAVDSKGNIYIADSGNNLIRKITIH